MEMTAPRASRVPQKLWPLTSPGADGDGRDGDRRARLGDGVAEDDEDAGAECGTDADHGELPQAEGAPQRASLALAALRDQAFHGLAAHQARADPEGRGAGRTAVPRGCALVGHVLAPLVLPVRGTGTGGIPFRQGTHRAGSPPRHVRGDSLRAAALPL
ncbi:hypothetical protein GCM10010254_45540 [Streptomyces chromofuscus]|nr:hypothetical protein GCM10010254_45540 [Streptomyces chromofuscus]